MSIPIEKASRRKEASTCPVRSVHFSEGDDAGWAIDEDLRLTRSALSGRIAETSLVRSEVVHAVWWLRLLPFSRRDLAGKHVLCNADNAPFYYVTEPGFLKAREHVTLWIARSHEAVAQFAALGLESRYAPYTFDPALFRPLPDDDPEMVRLIEKWKIPQDRYIIANFHRDTEGSDLVSPKLQKGPDAFLEIVTRLHEEGAPIHVLLAGPRRFYLRRKLTERGVPFTFVGQDAGAKDDFGVNILSRAALNVLYNMADLHLITSRWEGGPQSVMESAATRGKVISTPVGLAPDILAPECLFSDIGEACEIIRSDIRDNHLAAPIEAQYQRAIGNHTEATLQRHLTEIYDSLPVRPVAVSLSRAVAAPFRRVARTVSERFRSRASAMKIAIFHEPEKIPTSRDALLIDLGKEFQKRGNLVTQNRWDSTPDAVLVGQVGKESPLANMLRQQKDVPIIGLFDESVAGSEETLREEMDRRSSLEACTVLSSVDALEALRAKNLPPRRPLILPLTENIENVDAGSGPLVVELGNVWAATRIQAALANGKPVLYPKNSHYRYIVWFGGAAYDAAEGVAQKLDSLHADWARFARMTSCVTLPQAAERLLRAFKVCRELMADED